MKNIIGISRRIHTIVLALSLIMVMGLWSESIGKETLPLLGKEKIIYTRPSWPGPTLQANIGKILLEKMGYKVELKLVDTGIAYQALAGGSADIWSAAWLPGQQTYLNKFGDKLHILSASYLPAPGGLVTPAYVPISSIEDLKKPDIKKRFGGKVIGIDAGAGIMLTTEKVIKDYGLNYELVQGSTATMEAAFRSAVEKGEWTVVTGWCPTAMCAKYDIKFLQDPKQIYKRYQNFHIIRQGFQNDFPRATVFLSRFTLSESRVSQMILWVDGGMTNEQAAQRFMEEDPEVVWYWVGDLIPNFPKPASLQ